MADHTVTFARSARKELEQLPDEIAGRILERIENLAVQPRPPGVVKLIGGKNLWRIRVGDYRVVYAIDDTQRLVDISVIRHRREVYRGL
jgi:mRNA interferase RelE/StbE